MSDEEKPNLAKSISDQLATVGDGIPIQTLADRIGVKVNAVFRKTLWSAMEAHRASTGIHLEEANGCVRAVTVEEQINHGKRRFRKARTSERRGFEILDAAAERDPALAAKVGRVIHNATRNATQTATELRLRDDERRRALMLGEKS
jgi:hypothetical protein